ncbi:MAG: ribonuclease J [Chloroflexi bacterium]|nr:ribonuclease J [Chloroflexota bacterium]
MQNYDYGDDGELTILPLGGLGEIGKNMMYIEYATDDSCDAIIIDTGIMFPENDMLGIDYIIPDFQAIVDRFQHVRGVIITHGHEDHTGAIAHVMDKVNAPIYTAQLTRGLIEVKLRSARLIDQVTLVTVHPNDTVKIGPFIVEFVHMCHSIPDSLGLGITTPLGLIFHSGDFKFDHTPVDEKPPDFAKLAELASRGVLLMFADSTNVNVPGWTPSEQVIDQAFEEVFEEAEGRIIVSTFASLISRIQQVVNAAKRHNRKVAVTGHSMVENVKMARRLGYLDLPDTMMIDIGQINRTPHKELVILTTGTQGEPSAALSRMSVGTHRNIDIVPGDTVIMSAQSIPGNEELVSRTINKLFQRGANVLYYGVAAVHVSGHAAREELKLLHNLIRPQYFVPVHGELRHLRAHAELAQSLGMPKKNTVVVENGTPLTFTKDGYRVGERIPGGYVFVDGSGVGDVGPAVMRDREVLGASGFVIVNVVIDEETNELIYDPLILSRGFVYLREAEELLSGAADEVERVVDKHNRNNGSNGRSPSLSNEIERALDKYIYKATHRRPMIFAIVNRV